MNAAENAVPIGAEQAKSKNQRWSRAEITTSVLGMVLTVVAFKMFQSGLERHQQFTEMFNSAQDAATQSSWTALRFLVSMMSLITATLAGMELIRAKNVALQFKSLVSNFWIVALIFTGVINLVSKTPSVSAQELASLNDKTTFDIRGETSNASLKAQISAMSAACLNKEGAATRETVEAAQLSPTGRYTPENWQVWATNKEDGKKLQRAWEILGKFQYVNRPSCKSQWIEAGNTALRIEGQK